MDAAAYGTWVILPTYNERDNLEPVVDGIRRALRAVEHRILVVDDASPDGTGRLAEELPGVSVIHRRAKAGLGPAYVAGFAHALAAGAHRIFEMDADLSHDPADLPRLLAAVEAGADVALGSRYVEGGGVAAWGAARRAVSRAGCEYARAVLGVPVRDLTGGLKCFRADALRALEPGSVRSRGYAFQVELTYRALQRGLRVVEVPIVFRERREGRSKMSWRIALEAAWRVPYLRLRGSW